MSAVCREGLGDGVFASGAQLAGHPDRDRQFELGRIDDTAGGSFGNRFERCVGTLAMTRGECLQQVLETSARVTHAIGRLDSMMMQTVCESGEGAVDEIVAGRDASGAGRPQFAT